MTIARFVDKAPLPWCTAVTDGSHVTVDVTGATAVGPFYRTITGFQVELEPKWQQCLSWFDCWINIVN